MKGIRHACARRVWQKNTKAFNKRLDVDIQWGEAYS